jgi:GH15 family glucan-1,4-alpha-glucosidase
MTATQQTEVPSTVPPQSHAPAESARAQSLIEDYALIGDLRTAALVSKTGSIDFLCLPHFDSDACFASLLGGPNNGSWQIAPTVPVREVRRRYRKDTLILETDFVTDEGTLRLTDFMVRGDAHPQLVRTLSCLDGEVPVESNLTPRFAFGYAVPKVSELKDATQAVAGPDAVYLRGGPGEGAPPMVERFTVTEGEDVSYVLTYGTSFEPVPEGADPIATARETEKYWTDWCSQIDPPSRYREVVVRSLITLNACTFEPTGGIVAAPTTSLPETHGGIRNWDYRFTWLRDSVLALGALMNAGLKEPAEAFAAWLFRAVAGDPAQIQIMYGIRGERRLTETELPWLAGYENARPVRIGNGAYDQFQLDVFGEVAFALRFAFERFGGLKEEGLRSLLGIAKFVAVCWRTPDKGIWEMRGPDRSFTASKVAAWAALDCAIRTLEEVGSKEPLDELKTVRRTIFDEVCDKGFNAEMNSFTQYYGGTELDASLLFIPLSGFLPATDPRVVGTVAALERDLMEDGFLLRFKAEGSDVDGLSGKEGVFLACSFWLANTYHLMGRTEDARALFERLIGLCNDVGLLAEEYDTVNRRHLGNFPQAFSHFALVNSAYLIAESKREGPGYL